MNNHDYVVSLDIGTSSVRVVIGEFMNSSINIIGVGRSESEGIKRGAIVDIDLTVQSIRRAVESAEHMVGIDIHKVFVGISGNHIDLQSSQGVVAVSSDDREIGEDDIMRVVDASKVIALPPEREIIDVVPKQFIVDGLDGIKDPRGMIGVRLEMEGTIVTGSKTALHNLVRCIERAGLSIDGIFLQPLASSSIALSKDEKALGIVLADIGAGQITLSVYENGGLAAHRVIPIGGEYITNDIAIGLKTKSDVAEKVKIQHGTALIDEASEHIKFKISRIGSDQHKEFNQVDLAYIIEPRLVEMFEMIQQEVYKLGFSEIAGGYVLTGGVMSLPGSLDLAKEIMQHSVRVATPDYIGVREPQYTASVGMIKYAYENTKQTDEPATTPAANEKNPAARANHSDAQETASVTQKVKNWFKEFI